MKDHFGGIAAKQAIVCSLMKGTGGGLPKRRRAGLCFLCTGLTGLIKLQSNRWDCSNRHLLKHLLQHAFMLSEKDLMKLLKRGVPDEAARDFLLGHFRIQMAVLFNELPGAVFSDAANKALQRGLKEFIKEDWRKVFEPDNVKDQIESIT